MAGDKMKKRVQLSIWDKIYICTNQPLSKNSLQNRNFPLSQAVFVVFITRLFDNSLLFVIEYDWRLQKHPILHT